MTQAQEILALLRSRGDRGITPMDALEEVGTFRLAARIHDLRAEGYNITSTPQMTPTGKTVARYRLIEPKAYQQTTLELDGDEEWTNREGMPEFNGAFR